MTLDPELTDWLRQAGYENHVFISFARSPSSPDTLKHARRMRDAIRSELGHYIPEPCVFLDESAIAPGTEWERKLSRSLCRSVMMVAVCSPIYYDRSHVWCGREWAAMAQLSKLRLEPDETAILPVLIRVPQKLPEVVRRIQYIDFSKQATSRRDCYDSGWFKQHVLERVGERLRTIAECLKNNDVRPDCDEYTFPSETPFDDYQKVCASLPLRSG